MTSDSEDFNPYAADNFDPSPSELEPFTYRDVISGLASKAEVLSPQRVAVLRTSDSILFKRCRRAWGWGSHLRENLGSRNAASPLWIGSGFHFALEDLHGANYYGHPATAFQAYAIAVHKWRGRKGLPATWAEDLELAKGMLSYYSDYWLRNRDPLQTFVYNGVPQTEVNARILIPADDDMLRRFGYTSVIYSLTLDRVVIDENGILWIVEYKTAKAIQTNHLETDPQVTRYTWACELLYPGYPIGGVIYQQHKKRVPDEPRVLATGKLSTTTRQSTDYAMMRKAVINIYGSTEAAPAGVIETLNHFCALEEPESNAYVRRDKIYRNSHQTQAEASKILLEMQDMLNPDLPMYPNPTRDCGFCTFKGPCISFDDGGDWEEELDAYTMPRDVVYDSWRQYLPTLDEMATADRYVF